MALKLIQLPVRVGRRWGHINKQGTQVVPPSFEVAKPFSDGLAAVRVEHRWGYIDTRVQMVIEPRYESALEYAGGVACVRVFAKPKPLVATGSDKVIINLKNPPPS